MSSAPEPFTHAIASRDGLFFANRDRFTLVAEGQFFGMTLRGDDLYCFEAGDQPWVPSRLGRIVRFGRSGDGVGEREILVEGLDNGCHQIDFFAGSCFVVDTYNQLILEYDRDWRLAATHQPVPSVRLGEAGPDYFHINSFLGVDDSIFLLLHNGRLQRQARSSRLTARSASGGAFSWWTGRAMTSSGWRIAGSWCAIRCTARSSTRMG